MIYENELQNIKRDLSYTYSSIGPYLNILDNALRTLSHYGHTSEDMKRRNKTYINNTFTAINSYLKNDLPEDALYEIEILADGNMERLYINTLPEDVQTEYGRKLHGLVDKFKKRVYSMV